MNNSMIIKFDKMFNIIFNEKEGDEQRILRIPIKLWVSEIEDQALEQFKNLAMLPFAYHHIAGMPDTHYGYGMPIGGVLASNGYVIPNAVGKDIGCGMYAIRTNLFVGGLPKNIIKKIMSAIRKLIPIGVGGKRKEMLPMPSIFTTTMPVIEKEFENASKQIGTLGSGNHFIEIQAGSDGYIWIMVHSGSRNIGSKVNDYYNKIAAELNEKWFSSVPKSHQLAFLPIDHEVGKQYLIEMEYCCAYALLNRQTMIDKIKEAFLDYVDCEFDRTINIHHNYAAMEHHFGKNVLVHRKGATRAYEGEYGIIPGSQGTNSYIVIGKGNPDSFKSCSHGSGRVMSRTKAKEKLDLATEKKKLDDKGIIHAIRSKKDLEEASGAYKNINVVMNHQQDLVDIDVELTPMAVLKG